MAHPQGGKGMAGNTDRVVVADWRDTPAPMIVVNFPMEVVQGSPIAHTAFNGATRQIPGTQSLRSDTPSLEEEPRWMKLSTTAPAPAGAAMLRDIRAWVGNIFPPFYSITYPSECRFRRVYSLSKLFGESTHSQSSDVITLRIAARRHPKPFEERPCNPLLDLARPMVCAGEFHVQIKVLQ